MINPTTVASTVKELLKSRYRQIPSDENEKIIEVILKLWFQVLEVRMSRRSMLKEVAEAIHRSLAFQAIAIAVKDPKDDLYRYQVMVGCTNDVIDAMQKQAYSEAEVRASDRLPEIRISRLIDFTISEAPQKVVNEEAQFNRPLMAAMPRKAEDEFAPGDYMTILIPGRGDELLGFIEVSSPRDGKLPTGSRMKVLELLAIMVGTALQSSREEKEPVSLSRSR